jgi:hypothetical protein
LAENKNPGVRAPGERDIVCMSEKNSNPQGTLKSRGFTPIDNFVLDVVIPLVARKHPKYPNILTAVIRKTVGWGKQADWISLSQLQRASGAGRKCVVDGLRFWKQAGLVRRSGRHGIRGSVAYEFVVDYQPLLVTSSLIELVGRPDWFDEGHFTGSMRGTPLVRSSNTQKKPYGSASQNRKRNTSRERGAPAPRRGSEKPEQTYKPEVIYA